MVLIFLAFYLPGYLWTRQELLQSAADLRRYMLQFIIIALPQILLLLYVVRLRAESAGGKLNNTWAELGFHRLKPADLLYALVIFAGIFFLLLILGFLLSLVPAAGRELFAEGFRWKLDDPRLIPLVLLFCLVTGYREELFYRSYLITRFSHLQLPLALGIGLSTLLFAFGHVYEGISGFTVAVVQGLYFSILFIRFRNIHHLAVAHGLYNATVLFITLFVDPGLPIQP